MRAVGFSVGVAGGSVRAAGRTGFDPRSLFANGEAGAWFDAGAAGSLFADAAGTVAAAVDGPVARMADRSGRGNHVAQSAAGARPILRRDGGGRAYLAFDGVDDFLASAAPELRFTGPATLGLAVRREASGVYDVWMSAQTMAGNVNPYELRTNSSGTVEFVAASNTAIELSAAPAAMALPFGEDRVVTAARTGSGIEFTVGGFAAGGAVPIENASSAAHAMVPTADAGTEFRLGSRKGSPLFARGRMYAALIVGRLLTRAEGTALRGYLAASAGAVG